MLACWLSLHTQKKILEKSEVWNGIRVKNYNFHFGVNKALVMNNQNGIPACHSWTWQHLPAFARHHSMKTWLSVHWSQCLADWYFCQAFRQSLEGQEETYGCQRHSNMSTYDGWNWKQTPSCSASFAVQANWRGASRANMFYIFLGGGKNSRVTLLHDRHRDENHVEAPLRSPGKTITVVLRGNFFCLQNNE